MVKFLWVYFNYGYLPWAHTKKAAARVMNSMIKQPQKLCMLVQNFLWYLYVSNRHW